MGTPNDAKDFLQRHAALFDNEVVRGWQWGGEDDDFGKSHSWVVLPADPEAGQLIEATASVDLQLTQLTLSISERGDDSEVTFVALVQFEDRTLAVDGVDREYTDSEIAAVIREFNERTS